MLRVTVYHGSTIWFQGQAAEAVLPAEVVPRDSKFSHFLK